MQPKNNPSERGQAIVLIVLAIIALLGFTALAVDGSLVYADRRWAQNASDASALAGAGAAAEYLENNFIYRSTASWSSGNACTGVAGSAAVQAVAAAIARATENDYNLQNVADPLAEPFGGVKVECGIERNKPYLDVTTVVKETTDAAFAQVVFPGGLENTTTAVARVEPAIGLGYGNAIVALDERACRGGGFYYGLKLNGLGGGNYLEVHDGGIWSNGCLDGPGNPDVTMFDNGNIDYFDTGPALEQCDIQDPDNNCILPPARTDTDTMSIEDVTLTSEPLCNKSGNRYTANQFLTRGTSAGGLTPGLYCITNQLRINNNVSLTGHKVTVVLLASGGLTINGGAHIELSAPSNDHSVDPNGSFGDAIRGLLFYVPPTNTGCGNGCVSINGDSTTTFTGTILVPGGEVIFNGNNGATVYGQIIAYDVDVGGSSGASVTYVPDNVTIYPTYLNMQK